MENNTFINSEGKKVPMILKYYYTQKDKKQIMIIKKDLR